MKIPQGMHSVTPHLICAGAARAIDFYKQAFGAEETARLPGPDGRLMHAAIRIGDSTVIPFGHSWSVATPVREVSMEEAQKAMQEMAKSMQCKGD
jgi:catechol 2,3-dioxygenase-like lactoylglutathione lyase family enzyme